MMRLRCLIINLFLLSTGCRAVTAAAYPSADGIEFGWPGKTVEQPWEHSELAAIAIREVLGLEYPGHPELLKMVIGVYGSNDYMFAPSTPNWTTNAEGYTSLTNGSTESNECGAMGFECDTIIRVRQIRLTTTKATSDPKDLTMVYSGPLLDIDASALWYEVANRFVPIKLLGSIGGEGTMCPGLPCNDLRAKIRERYYQLRNNITPPPYVRGPLKAYRRPQPQRKGLEQPSKSMSARNS